MFQASFSQASFQPAQIDEPFGADLFIGFSHERRLKDA